MALDKAIQSGKEHRKPYKGSKAFDLDCRNHGKCPKCTKNRLYKSFKELDRADYGYTELQEKERVDTVAAK